MKTTNQLDGVDVRNDFNHMGTLMATIGTAAVDTTLLANINEQVVHFDDYIDNRYHLSNEYAQRQSDQDAQVGK
jgi:hypothetical protein